MWHFFEKEKEFILSKNLAHSEFRCRCNNTDCNFTIVYKSVIEAFQRVRDIIKEPIEVTSGFRCQKHNSSVGGVVDSRHMRGQAIDMAYPADIDKKEFIDMCAQNFDYIIECDTFVHCHIEGER